jgi:hypothetical protein
MPDSARGSFTDELLGSEAADRLKEELRGYVQARAQQAVSGLGDKLEKGLGGLAGSGGALADGVARGGKALAEGKSPAGALASAGASHLKDTLVNTVKDKVKGVFGKGRKGGGGKSKSVTIVEDIDVGVPLREAYDQWTQFQEFSTFAKGVVSVEKSDDTSSNWKVKVAKSTRSWTANVTEQVPDERITWTTEGAKGTVKGVVTFHAITDDLTRVLLVLEYFPKGLFEKTGNIWRAQGRRARLDLKLYRKFIMMRGEATDGWRGEIRDGEVVVDHEEAVEREQEEASDSAGNDDGEEFPDEEREFDDEASEDELPEDEIDDGEDPEGVPEDEFDGEEIPEDESAGGEEEFADEDGSEDELPEDEEEFEAEEEPATEEPEERPARSRRRRAPAAR